MKHTVTIVYEVEAEDFGLAVEAVLREPLEHMTACRVKTPGKRLTHIMPSVIKQAVQDAAAKEVNRDR